MPMYDYRCKACGAHFEAWQKFSDDPISVCPTCAGPAQRVIHAAGIMFKGSGFYSTDTKSHTAIPPTDATTAPAAAADAPKATSEASASTANTPATAATKKPASATSSAPTSAAAQAS